MVDDKYAPLVEGYTDDYGAWAAARRRPPGAPVPKRVCRAPRNGHMSRESLPAAVGEFESEMRVTDTEWAGVRLPGEA